MGEWVLTGNIKGEDGLSASHYSHTQTTPSTTWFVNHNLGFRPNVAVLVNDVDVSDGVIVTHVDTNQCTVTSNQAIAGKAECS